MKIAQIKTKIQNLVNNFTDAEVLAKKSELNSKETPILCFERFMASNDILNAEIIKRKLCLK